MSFSYETVPVIYNSSLVKYRRSQNRDSNSTCFITHWHDRMEILKVVEGTLFVKLGLETIVAKKNDVVIIPPKTPHYGYTEEEAVKYVGIMFDIRNFYNNTPSSKTQLEPIFNGNINFEYLTSNENVNSAMNALTIDLFQSLENYDKDLHDLYVMSCLYNLIFQLFAHCKSNVKKAAVLDEKILTAIKYIEEHYNVDLDINALAKHVGYSPSHFSIKFKENTGLSPANYIKTKRLEKSYSLLQEGNYTISEVAAKCGFSDSNYFTRCFKKHFNYTPTFFLNQQHLEIADKT